MDQSDTEDENHPAEDVVSDGDVPADKLEHGVKLAGNALDAEGRRLFSQDVNYASKPQKSLEYDILGNFREVMISKLREAGLTSMTRQEDFIACPHPGCKIYCNSKKALNLHRVAAHSVIVCTKESTKMQLINVYVELKALNAFDGVCCFCACNNCADCYVKNFPRFIEQEAKEKEDENDKS